MAVFTRRKFRQIADRSAPGAVSIIVPARDVIQFKNQIKLAQRQLVSLGFKEVSAALANFSAPYLTDRLFWKSTRYSMGFYLADSFNFVCRFPFPVRTLAMVSDHFYIRPFFRIFDQKIRFYILDLDRNRTRLWRGNDFRVFPVKIPDLPQSIPEVAGEEQGERPAAYHGSSQWQDDKGRYQERFFKNVDKSVIKYLHRRPYPVILCGAKALTTSYRKISGLPNLYGRDLPKPDHHDNLRQTLHLKAAALLAEFFRQKRSGIASAYREESNPGKKSDTIHDIISAAAAGRVRTLLIAKNCREFGPYGIYPRIELLNLAARLVYLSRGRVHILPRREIPGRTILAAIYRY